MKTPGREISRLANDIAADEKQGSRRVDSALKDQSRENEERKKRQKRMLAILSTIFAVLTATNLAGLNPLVDQVAPPTAEEIELAALAAVEGVVDDLEDWHAEWGTFPEAVDDLADPIGVWSYERFEEDGYQLRLEAEGASVAYDSNQERSEFFSRLRNDEEGV